MKPRHIIMIIILVLFATIMFSLKADKDKEKIVCTSKGDFQGMNSTITLNVGVKDNNIKDMDITIDAIVPEELQAQKQEIISYMTQSGKMTAKSTKDGIKFEMGIESEYFKSLGLSTKTNPYELKQALEIQGYNCK